MKKGVLENFTKFTGKHMCQGLFLIEMKTEVCNFIKKRPWHMFSQVFTATAFGTI